MFVGIYIHARIKLKNSQKSEGFLTQNVKKPPFFGILAHIEHLHGSIFARFLAKIANLAQDFAQNF